MKEVGRGETGQEEARSQIEEEKQTCQSLRLRGAFYEHLERHCEENETPEFLRPKWADQGRGKEEMRGALR